MGGFDIRNEDKPFIASQRAITKQINEKFIPVGAVYLKMSGKMPIDEEWAKSAYKDTNLQDWIDDESRSFHNVGFNLQQGWVDFDIDAGDPEFNRCVIAAMEHLGLDTRFRFGRRSAGIPTHVLIQLGEEEASNFEQLSRFAPKEFRIDGDRYHVEIRSYPTNTDSKNLYRSAKQTVMPGSIYSHKSKADEYDISVWWDSENKPADRIQRIASTTPRRASFNDLVRAIAFATFLYVVKDQWVEGSRQSTATKVAGWLARVVADSQAMNNHEVLSADVYCPVDDDSIVESLIQFVCGYMGDDEPHMRIRTYYDAQGKLARNPDAKIPGWPSIEQLFGGERVMALRAVFTPGSDVSILSAMAERYIYDETDNLYIDRRRHVGNGRFAHENNELYTRHKGDVVRIGGKPKEAFKVYESSDMRKRVDRRDMFPELGPGGIYRVDNYGNVLEDDDEDTTASSIFNTWRGWPIPPTDHVNEELMTECISKLDQLFAYLTRDNANQIKWAKENIAWIFQNPSRKQQIAWVCVGGQGVGKSFFGNVFMKAMMGRLWGSASPKVMEGNFSVEPFVDKMFVFIDEAKFSGDASTDEVKKIIRNVDIGGSEKFQSARDYRIYSRVMFASNRFDVNVGQSGVVDRALFYTRAYDKDHLHKSELEFRSWAEGLKPWFVEYADFMERRDVKEHYMRYFMELPVSKQDVESIKYSSSSDALIVEANMSWSRRIAKAIIEEGRIHDDLALEYPFTQADLNRRVVEQTKEMGLRAVQGGRVLQEWDDAGLVERYKEGPKIYLRFTHKHATSVEMFEKATGLTLHPPYEFTENDVGLNTTTTRDRAPWRGGKEYKF
jgi:hypothetical protein